jgi:hypothetical protein
VAIPSANAAAVAGNPEMTQWTQVPAGASGSSQMRAKLRVPAGASLQAKGGETSAPSHVYFTGIGFPSIQATLVNFMVFSSCAIEEPTAAAIQPAATNPSRSHVCR